MGNTVTVGTPRYSLEDGKQRLSAPIDLGTSDFSLYYLVSEGPVAVGSEPFLAASLIPAMKLGLSLYLPKKVSSRLLASMAGIQDIFSCWEKSLKPVKIEAISGEDLMTGGGQEVGCFFSGGVDSFYTVLKHQPEITKLIFVHGFDLSLENYSLREKASAAVQKAAKELDKPLIEVETNLRQLLKPYLSWDLAHGPALASVALLLAPRFNKIYIPSTRAYSELHPWGSHPLIDPLWGTENLEIVHDGCESTRPMKVARIAESDTALRYLRVCWQNINGKFNCGCCEKCLRTMVSLHLAGVLERCATFGHQLNLKALANLKIQDRNQFHFVKQNFEAAQKAGGNEALVKALGVSLKRWDNQPKGLTQRVFRRGKEVVLSLCKHLKKN